LAHLLAAREDLSKIIRTSSGISREKTACAINKVGFSFSWVEDEFIISGLLFLHFSPFFHLHSDGWDRRGRGTYAHQFPLVETSQFAPS
jgi:hypothetical protein